MLEKIIQKLISTGFPDRDIEVVKTNEGISFIAHDTLRLFYSLQGTYRYEEILQLNQLTGKNVQYGFCPGFGPTAIIGIDSPEANFKYLVSVSAYGEVPFSEHAEFNRYLDEDAKQVSNYTVYGTSKIEEIADFVKFDKIDFELDNRYKDAAISHEKRVLRMKCALDEQYTFKECKYIAAKQTYWAVDRSMAFATLENGKHVAIMSFSYDRRDEAIGFRDVWESRNEEPPAQKITFITDKEASKIEDFTIYLYDYSFFCIPDEIPHVAKLDRTFERYFDFYNTPDGKDLRFSNNF